MSYLECAESQLAEIDLLCSMFSEDELLFSDPVAVALLRGFVEDSGPLTSREREETLTSGERENPPSSRPQFQIRQKIQQEAAGEHSLDVTVSCAFPSEYPRVLPEITVRCSAVTRAQQSQLHSDLARFLQENCGGEPCVLSAVDWLRDHLQEYVIPASSSCTSSSSSCTSSTSSPLQQTFTRLWIYSHHIYNRTKRKNILDWSKELGLSGFSLPGKPGVVCVEGEQEACEDFWSRVKVLTWKKIMIRHREDVALDPALDPDRTLDSLRKFSGFEEAAFEPHGNRGNHMDLGRLFHFLNERGLRDVFQIYFGVEGR